MSKDRTGGGGGVERQAMQIETELPKTLQTQAKTDICKLHLEVSGMKRSPVSWQIRS